MDIKIPGPPVPAPVQQAPLMAHDDNPPEPPLPLVDELAQPPINGYSEDVDVPVHACRREVTEAQVFIRAMQTATLDGSGLSGETVARLRTALQQSWTESAALRMFLVRGDTSEDNYADNQAAMTKLHPEDEQAVPTYEQVKRLVANITSIDALLHDMCVNSCVAFTGPFVAEQDCPTCGEPRYEQEDGPRGRKVPCRTFHTYPLGPQIQAMYASPENARLMRHRAERTSQIQAQLRADPTSVKALDNVYWGNNYLGAVGRGEIKPDNTAVMMSLDGAQLYKSKTSDCWFYVWVLYDLPPTSRYKKRYILPRGVIGGPKKPKNIDSFLFPRLYHVAALQCEGLKIWDAAREQEFRSDPYLYLATADGPGMAYLSGLVGHQGARGCRLYCSLLGRFKGSALTYYPAMWHADGNTHAGSNHPDYVRPDNVEASDVVSAHYQEALGYVVSSHTHAEYTRCCLETGIAKPSIFSGLPRILSLPGCFGADLMHLLTLNLTDLMISYFCGTMPCDPTNDQL